MNMPTNTFTKNALQQNSPGQLLAAGTLSFFGAAGTVTGSKYLLKAKNKRILIDCGLFQGFKQLRLRNWAPFPFDVRKLDAVVLTHAHIDHSGALPLLAKQGYSGPVYCTEATRELCEIMLPDAAHLQEEEANYANRHAFSKHSPALPLYTAEDANRSLALLKPVAFDDPLFLAGGLSVQWCRAGHILGSASLSFDIDGRKLVFSGDLGRPNDAVMKPPTPPAVADWLVVESTYGNRKHSDIDPVEAIFKILDATIKRGGVLVIPAFAVGRAQSILYYLYCLHRAGRIPPVPIYLNSPMAVDATHLFMRHGDEHHLSQADYQGMCKMVRIINTTEESRRLNTLSGPMVIVSASGMATGGRVLHHIKQFGPDKINTILFAGFQAAGTRGAKLVEGATEIKMFGEYVPIRAEVANLDCLSSHADYSEIIDWLRRVKIEPVQIYITHGEPTAADTMRIHLEESLGWRARVPDYLETVELR